MSGSQGAQLVPQFMTDADEHRRQIVLRLNGALQGKINATLDVTLNASQTSTVMTDARIAYTSAIVPAMPMTANAAAAVAAGIYVDTVTPGIGATQPTATIHHASNAATDQTIRFLIIG